MNRVTVFTPTYNRARVLYRVLGSLLQQTFRDFEWLIIDVFDSDDLKGYFKLKLRFEKWMLFRTEVLRSFPFLEEDPVVRFFPETVLWQRIARRYKTRYIDALLRAYYRDQGNAFTSRCTLRFQENVYLWAHFINDTMDYFFDSPHIFVKAFTGLVRDSLLKNWSVRQIIGIPNAWWKKQVLCILFLPAGFILYKL